jgi:hypothetical protein
MAAVEEFFFFSETIKITVSKAKQRESQEVCLGVSKPKRYSALWDLTDICRSTAPICLGLTPLLAW